MAQQVGRLWSTRHLRLQKRPVLLLQEFVVQGRGASHLSTLELARQGRKDDSGDLLYQLRYRGALPQWREPGRERICLSPPWNDREIRPVPSASKDSSDYCRSAPSMGRGIRPRYAYRKGDKRWQGRTNNVIGDHFRSEQAGALCGQRTNPHQPQRRGTRNGSCAG